MSKLDFNEIDSMLEKSAPFKDVKSVYRIDMVVRQSYYTYVSAKSEQEAMGIARQSVLEDGLAALDPDEEFEIEPDDISIWNVTELWPDDEEDE